MSVFHLCHPAARFLASPACLGALAHLLVASHLFAAFATGPADLGTGGAGLRVERGAPEHEVRARLADLGAIEHEPDVVRLGMLPSLTKTVADRLGACVMTGVTYFNAIAKLSGRDALAPGSACRVGCSRFHDAFSFSW
jgi:hypothetical protein